MPAPRILHQADVVANVDERVGVKAVAKPATPTTLAPAALPAAAAAPTKAEFDNLNAAVVQLRTVLKNAGLVV